MEKLRRYFYGGIIGMCLEYVYRVESDVWYIPLSIAIIFIVLAIVDCSTTPTKGGK